MAASFLCPICSTSHPERSLYRHIPICYYDSCVDDGVEPACNYSECRERQSHKEKIISVPQNIIESPPKTSLPTSASLNSSSTSSPNPPRLLKNPQITGSSCCICDTQKPPSQISLPYIKIDNYRQLMLCKKAHLSKNEDLEKLGKAIDEAVQNAVESPHFNLVRTGSGEATTSNSEEYCSGYKKLVPVAEQ